MFGKHLRHHHASLADGQSDGSLTAQEPPEVRLKRMDAYLTNSAFHKAVEEVVHPALVLHSKLAEAHAAGRPTPMWDVGEFVHDRNAILRRHGLPLDCIDYLADAVQVQIVLNEVEEADG